MSTSRSLEADVVVVGAGLAGLVAAERLAGDRRVIVLEARDRVGGRTLNADIGDGGVVELGGQWIGPTQDRLEALAGELGIGTFPTHADGDNLLELDGRLRRYRGTIPRLGIRDLLALELTRRRVNRLARRVSLASPWEARDAVSLDARSFGDWLESSAAGRSARRLVTLAGRTVWGAEPEELSLLHVLFYVHSAGSLDRLLDVAGGAQERRFEGGSQALSLRLAERLGDRVVLAAPVREIRQGGSAVTAVGDGVEVNARRAIAALPPNLAGGIAFEPALPAARQELHRGAPQGALVKCMALYPEPFWRVEGLSGEGVSDAGPATLTFDNSPPGGRPGVLLGFVGGADARSFVRLDAGARRQAVLAGLERLFGPRAARPDGWLEQSWPEDPWTGGGPNVFLRPGVWTAHGRALRAPVGRVHWAGAETSERWCGYLDGAVRSGERAAAEVLAGD